MKITKTSMLTGTKSTMDLDVTLEGLDLWREGELIQNVFPNLSPDEREFLMTGVTPEEWEVAFQEEED